MKAAYVDAIGDVLDPGCYANLTQKLLELWAVCDQRIEGIVDVAVARASKPALAPFRRPSRVLGYRIQRRYSGLPQPLYPGARLGAHIGQQLRDNRAF